MKATPTERAALDAARSLTPLPLEDAAALAGGPDIRRFAGRHDRVRLAQTRLAHAADAWRRRALRLSLYAQALRRGDRIDAFRERVTALDIPTARVRADLVAAHRALVDAECSEFELF